MKIHVHIANISKNISDLVHGLSDINLLSTDLKLEIMNKIKSNKEFGYVKIYNILVCKISILLF